jgi:hypothetical protein
VCSGTSTGDAFDLEVRCDDDGDSRQVTVELRSDARSYRQSFGQGGDWLNLASFDPLLMLLYLTVYAFRLGTIVGTVAYRTESVWSGLTVVTIANLTLSLLLV